MEELDRFFPWVVGFNVRLSLFLMMIKSVIVAIGSVSLLHVGCLPVFEAL